MSARGTKSGIADAEFLVGQKPRYMRHWLGDSRTWRVKKLTIRRCPKF